MKWLRIGCLLMSGLLPAMGRAQLQYGPQAGIHLSRFSNSNLGEVRFKPSLHAGAYLEIPSKKKLAWRIDVLYNRQGALLRTDEDVRYRIHFIQAGIACTRQIKQYWVLGTGPQAGYALSRVISGGTNTIAIDNFIRQGDLSWMVFAGHYFPAWRTGVMVRYAHSLLNAAVQKDPAIRHQHLGLSFYYRIRKGKT